jgi:ATP phosphoribosyltransferase regulatory subunit
MTQKKSSSRLLPVGFYDLLFDEAEKNHENVNLALSAFLKAGYRLIKTPLVEFEDNFSADEARNSFRATDVISGENLIFRNDITLQISRLLASRLKFENLPLKICYVGDVLYAKSENLYADREQTQVGIEIIGCDAEKSDLEIIETLLASLEKLEMRNLLIEFSLPNFLEIFLDEIAAKKKAELRVAVMKKNLSAIKNLAEKNAEIISKIATSNDDLENLIAEISAQTNSQKISEELQKAQKISEFLGQRFEGIITRFDLFGDHESSYHRGISFDVFSNDFSYPIARGGRYKIENHDAVGATIYMNRLRKVSN